MVLIVVSVSFSMKAWKGLLDAKGSEGFSFASQGAGELPGKWVLVMISYLYGGKVLS